MRGTDSIPHCEENIRRKEKEDEERQERRRIADEQSRQREREQRDLERNLGMEVEDPSIVSDLLSSATTGAFRWLIFDAPRRSAASAHFRKLQKPLPAETPAFISLGKQEGLNCQLTASVTVTRADGQTQQLHPEMILHAPHDESLDLRWWPIDDNSSVAVGRATASSVIVLVVVLLRHRSVLLFKENSLICRAGPFGGFQRPR